MRRSYEITCGYYCMILLQNTSVILQELQQIFIRALPEQSHLNETV